MIYFQFLIFTAFNSIMTVILKTSIKIRNPFSELSKRKVSFIGQLESSMTSSMCDVWTIVELHKKLISIARWRYSRYFRSDHFRVSGFGSVIVTPSVVKLIGFISNLKFPFRPLIRLVFLLCTKWFQFWLFFFFSHYNVKGLFLWQQ